MEFENPLYNNSPYHHQNGYNNHYHISIPPSTKDNIVFPYKMWSGRFQTSHYQLFMTDSLISLTEINAFLVEVEKILHTYRSKYNSMKWWICGLLILMIAAVAIPSALIGIKSPDLSYLIPIIAVPLFLTFSIVLCCIQVKANKNFVSKIQETSQDVLDLAHQRAGVFEQRGFHWVIPHGFPYWIELWRGKAGEIQPAIENQGSYAQQGHMRQQRQDPPSGTAIYDNEGKF